MYRQGDILIRRVTKIPDTAVPHHDRVLRRGTATGHAHALRSSDSSHVFRDGADVFISAQADAYIDHPEHGTISLPPGDYAVTQQREYKPEGIQYVQD